MKTKYRIYFRRTGGIIFHQLDAFNKIINIITPNNVNHPLYKLKDKGLSQGLLAGGLNQKT